MIITVFCEKTSIFQITHFKPPELTSEFTAEELRESANPGVKNPKILISHFL